MIPVNVDELRAHLRRSDFSHVSYRSWCGQDLLWIYRREPKSPTHCEVMFGCEDTPETRRILAEEGKRAQAGGQMQAARVSTASTSD